MGLMQLRHCVCVRAFWGLKGGGGGVRKGERREGGGLLEAAPRRFGGHAIPAAGALRLPIKGAAWLAPVITRGLPQL